MRTFAQAFILAGWLVGSAAAVPAPVFADDASAEPAEADGRAAAFQSASGPTRENVPGGKLLVLAYGLVWLAVLGFVTVQWRRTQRVEADVDRLRKALDGRTRETGGGGS